MTALRVETAERENRALQMRIGGATYEQIAKQIPYASKGAAYNAVSRALKRIPRESANRLRDIEIERFDAIQIRLMSHLAQGDLSVVPALLRLSEQRMRLLGLDKPVQVELRHDVVEVNSDPATLRMRAAIEAAKERRDAMRAEEVNDETVVDAEIVEE